MGSFILFVIIGLIAGWIAGLIMKGRGFGMLGDIIIGIIGALIGGFVFNLFGFSPNTTFLGSIITAIVGAVILLLIISMVRRAEI